jgi:hypothetical protein
MAFDLIYCDFERLNLLRAQFGAAGLRTAYTESTEASRDKTTTTESEISGGVPIVASGKMISNTARKTAMQKSQSETYDTTWPDVVSFVERFSATQYNFDVSRMPRIGSLIRIEGGLDITDLETVKKLMETKSIKGLISSGAKGSKNNRNNASENFTVDHLFDILSVLPHSIQAIISNKSATFWSTLNRNFLLTPSAEIMLKHGTSIQGDWQVLGILDAYPDQTELSLAGNQTTPNFVNEGLGAMIGLLVPLVRMLLGRKSWQVGITPLVIFRQFDNH